MFIIIGKDALKNQQFWQGAHRRVLKFRATTRGEPISTVWEGRGMWTTKPNATPQTWKRSAEVAYPMFDVWYTKGGEQQVYEINSLSFTSYYAYLYFNPLPLTLICFATFCVYQNTFFFFFFQEKIITLPNLAKLRAWRGLDSNVSSRAYGQKIRFGWIQKPVQEEFSSIQKRFCSLVKLAM